MNRLHAYMNEKQPIINQTMEQVLPKADLTPGELHEAMRHSVLGGGKRMRPLLVLMASEVCGGTEKDALPAACALEFIHCYSLVHDDLPSMDNDEIRRGKLACHKAFSEATAILAGDALLTLAFEVLASRLPPSRATPACVELARAAGHVGMVGGQALDLEAEGQELDIKRIEAIDRWKTGALISASCRIGGIAAGGTEEQLHALEAYGKAIGIVFQITDDILDIESTTEQLGKTVGKDAEQKKLTYPAALGIEKAQELAKDLAAEAKSNLKGFGKEALMLRLLADYIVERKK